MKSRANKLTSAKVSLNALCLVAYLFLYCTVGGPSDGDRAGGETLNEKYAYLPDGKTPAAFAKVVFSNDTEVVAQDYTNEKGMFRIPSLETNSYSVYITKDSGHAALSAIQDSVYISRDSNDVQDDTLHESGIIVGFIKLQPQHRNMLRHVLIEIKGTYLEATPDDSGRFELKNVPRNNRYYLRFTPPAELGYAPHPLLEINYDNRPVYYLDTISFYNSNIPVVESLDVSYDSINGVVNLSWNKVNADVLEYVIIRELLEKNDSSIDSLRGDSNPFFADTLYASKPDLWQHSIDDTVVYKYRYWVVARANGRKTGELYANSTITVVSPLKTKSVFKFTILDSVTKKPVSTIPIKRTVEIITTVRNDYFPFNTLKIIGDSTPFSFTWEKPGFTQTDTLYWKDSATGIKDFTAAVKSGNGYRDFDTAKFRLQVNDINLSIEKVELVKPAIRDRQFAMRMTIKNYGASDLPANSNVEISWLFDDSSQISQSYAASSLKSGESFYCTLDSLQLQDAGWKLTPGMHKITVSVNSNKSIDESNTSDNSSDYLINISDVDLVIDTVELYPQKPAPGDLVVYRAWVVNKGSTANDSTIPIRVSFGYDDTASSQSIVYRALKPGDSVLVSSVPRNALEGENKVVVSIECDPFIRYSLLPSPEINASGTFETNDKNNSLEKITMIQEPKYIDLAIKSFGIDQLSRDTGITFSAVIQNDGNIDWGDQRIKIRISLNEKWTVVINPYLMILTPGQPLYVSPQFGDSGICNYLSTDTSSVYNATITIDPDDSLEEKNESNNTFSTRYITNEIFINGDFEDNILLTKNLADTIHIWHPRWSLTDSLTIFRWEDSAGINNSKCLSIENNECNDAHWTLNMKNIMQPGHKYRLSGWVRGENIETCQVPFGANLCIDNWGNDHTAQVLTGTFDWTYIEMLYQVPDPLPDNFVGISCRLGFFSAMAKGKAYFDNLKLERIP